jgi:hypothetical protein
MPQLHTLKDISKLLNLPYSTLLFYHRTGKLQGTRFGYYVLVDLEEAKVALADAIKRRA